MNSVYTPAWLDEEGNRLIFLSKEHLFEVNGEAWAKQIATYGSFREVGLSMDGVAELKLGDDGNYKIPHVEVKMWLWDGLCIGGPLFEAAE